jgi:hypothetical protein
MARLVTFYFVSASGCEFTCLVTLSLCIDGNGAYWRYACIS